MVPAEHGVGFAASRMTALNTQQGCGNSCGYHVSPLYYIVAVITLALFVTALFLLGCAIKNAKLAKKICS